MRAHYPWPQYRGVWPVDVELSVDGEDRGDLVSTDTHRVGLDRTAGWRRARLTLSAGTTEKPPGYTGEAAAVIVSVPPTNTRYGVEMVGSPGAWTADCELDLSFVAGAVELSVVILDPDSRRVIGNGESWTVVCDAGDAPARTGAPPFDTVWEDFSRSDRQLLRRASSTYALLDVEPPRPVLYLNDAVEGLQKLLSMAAPKLEKRRLRAVIETSIARDAARTLFRAGLEGTTVDGDQVDLPNDHLRRQILEKVADHIPSIEDLDELCRLLKGADTDSVTTASTWALVDAAIDGLVDHSRSVATSVEEVRFV